MTAGDKMIFGISIDQFHADLVEESAAMHEEVSQELNSWLQYLSPAEIQQLITIAKTAARAEIARRQGVQNA